MANSYLNRTPSGAGNRKTFTISMWFKRSKLGSSQYLFNAKDGSNPQDAVFFSTSDTFYVGLESISSGLETNRKFRDTSAWYNFVVAVDTTQGTNTNRVKLYVNGVQETSFNSPSYPSQNADCNLNTAIVHNIGRRVGTGGDFIDGYMSHIAFVDGTALAPTVFGETDSTSGIWKFKSPSGVTWGNNGFHLKFENSGALGTDSSGNTNTFTVNGNLKQAVDTPSNVYATINSLFVNDNGAANALTQGNNTYTSGTSHEWNNMTSTLGAVTGKWYWEVKYTQIINSGSIYMCDEGVAADLAAGNYNLGEGSRSGYGYGWLCGQISSGSPTSTTKKLTTINGTSTITQDDHNSAITANDIVGVAWDATNGKLWFHKNGTYIDDTSGNVGNPTTAAYPYISGMETGLLYTLYADVWNNNSGSSLIKSYNFGNGYFGTTAVSSAGTNASGIGIFEYDVPTGFTALSTKGLNL